MKEQAEEPRKEKYHWAQFDEDMQKIADWAREYSFKSVYGLPRGGLVPAVALSHLLDIPLILDRHQISRDTLVVDDIIDKGEIIERFLSGLLIEPKIAVIFFNEEATHRPDFFVRTKKYWVVFPWETSETSRYDMTVS